MSNDTVARSGPLDGITVVSLEQAVAAPFATRQLADLGARVIKIERPGAGDFARGYDHSVKGLASYFVWLNRSKESLSLDVKSAAGQEVLAALVARADVFVQNLAPGSAARLGLGTHELRARHPRLVSCDISGYGSDGPYRDRKAYDLMIQCETGLLAVTGTPDEPAKAGISVADIAAGTYAFAGIQTALLQRFRTGEGTTVAVSLFDALTEWMAQPLYYAMYTGTPPARSGAAHATIAPYGAFRAADGLVQLAIQNEREWNRFCAQVLDRPQLTEDPRFATNADRVAYRTELVAEIEEVFAPLPVPQVLRRLERAGIVSGRMNDVADVLEHPQLAGTGRWREVATPAGPVRALDPPARIGGVRPVMGAVPAVGEHTDAILAELGYGTARIAALHESGVV
ncbi:MAG TPA: CaiB/BaiF CoA-transferase family protein [Mycobacteriales bacterium]|nr:CaiB/BaiF CoA-transferase family protein [Mycobacteriales bacterium]